MYDNKRINDHLTSSNYVSDWEERYFEFSWPLQRYQVKQKTHERNG